MKLFLCQKITLDAPYKSNNPLPTAGLCRTFSSLDLEGYTNNPSSLWYSISKKFAGYSI